MTNMDVIIEAIKRTYIVVDTEKGIIRRTRIKGGKKCKPYPAYLSVDYKGYFYIALTTDGFIKSCKAHRIVWAAKYGRIPENLVINHKDCDKQNNRIENLELMTPLENVRHSVKNGCRPSHKGELNRSSKLKNAEVRAMRKMFATGSHTKLQLADRFNVSDTTVWKIITRQSWTHI